MKERAEQDSKLVNKLNNHVEQIQIEIQKHAQNSGEMSPDFEFITQEEIPKLQRELTNEVNLRRELESKILEQFMEQISELNDIFNEEKREREAKEEEIVSTLKSVSQEVEGMIDHQKGERERNEELILNLIEQIIERLRNEALDNDI